MKVSMTMPLIIRILSYTVAVLALAVAANETREYFVNGAKMSRLVALIKIGGPLVAGVLAIIILVLTQRHDDRVEIENEVKEARLRGTIASLENQLSTEAKTIRTLTMVANIHFSGQWDANDLPFSDQYYIAQPEHQLFVSGFGSLPHQLQFYGTKMYRFVETPGGNRVFAVEGAIRPGSWPLGHTIDEIAGINSAAIMMPIIAPAKLKSPHLRIHSALIQFIVNEKLLKKFVWEETDTINQDHIFLPPNANFDNRLVYVSLSDPQGLKGWENIR